MKGFFLATAVAATLAFAMPTAASADTKVRVYLGMPHYGYQMGPDYRYRDGYGWYRPVGIHRGRLSCGEARRIVRNNGFRNVATIECNGRTYTFEATRRGRDVTVFVNSRNGRVWRG
ncbi:MAG TPA: hypothetical protein VM144_10530 [Aestuariivirga sp.]|nr:hypothetical protein [Aestuariivirga sp.]